MKHTMFITLELVAAAVLTACSGPPGPEATCPDGTSSLEEGCPSASPPADKVAPDDTCTDSPPREAPPREAPAAAAGAFVATRTADGGVALVDIESGAVLTEALGGDLDGAEADIACDPHGSRVLVFESDADSEWGEVASYPIDHGARRAGDPPVAILGPRDHEVWIDGIARVAPSPSGVVVFEDGAAGPRWKLVSDQGPTPSLFAPRPASLTTGPAPGGLFRVTALTYGPFSDALEIHTATVEPSGILSELVAPLDLDPPGDWPSVRAVWTNSGPQLLSALDGDLVHSPSSGAPGDWTAIDPGAWVERLEHAVALPGGDTFVALVSGNADIVAVTLGPDGAPACAEGADLPGEVSGSLHFFTRGLVAAGPGRVLAATSEGVFAVTVSGACPLEIEIDLTFPGDALRGPLDVCSAGK